MMDMPQTGAIHLDGQVGAVRRITLHIDIAAQALRGPDIDWPLADIRALPDQAGRDGLILHLATDPVQRLILPDDSLGHHFPQMHRPAPAANRGAIAKWAVAALASVALIVFVLVPVMADQLATFIPPEGERALGEVTLNQIRDALDETGVASVPLCTAPAGQAALDHMRSRLESVTDLPTALSVHVLDHPMVNAFALPGGHIVLFRGLIDAADTPESLAAVFAHEIGHVVSRDPTRHALRSAGSIGVLGLLFGDFAGGALVLFLTERLIDAQYSQGAEAAADVFAHGAMIRAQMSPDALARMFETLRAQSGDAEGLLAHFLSHPALGNRIEAARAAVPADFKPQPLLSPDEWRALQEICQGRSSQ